MDWPCPCGFSDYVCFGHSGSPWSGCVACSQEENFGASTHLLTRILAPFRSTTFAPNQPPIARPEAPLAVRSSMPLFALDFREAVQCPLWAINGHADAG